MNKSLVQSCGNRCYKVTECSAFLRVSAINKAFYKKSHLLRLLHHDHFTDMNHRSPYWLSSAQAKSYSENNRPAALGAVRDSVSVKRRLRTAGPGVKCRLSVKWRPQTESKTQAGVKCRMKTGDFLNICAISYSPCFLVEVHCTFARSFNEHRNSLSLRTLISNTFIEGHPNFL